MEITSYNHHRRLLSSQRLCPQTKTTWVRIEPSLSSNQSFAPFAKGGSRECRCKFVDPCRVVTNHEAGDMKPDRRHVSKNQSPESNSRLCCDPERRLSDSILTKRHDRSRASQLLLHSPWLRASVVKAGRTNASAAT